MIKDAVSDIVPEMVGLRDAAARTGLSYGFLRRLCLSGQIVHIRCGNKFLVNFQKLCDYLNGEK